MLAAAALCLPASLSANCYGNCTHLTVDHGYLVGAGGGGSGPVWVGTNWSSIARLLAERMPDVGALPGMDANASTMRQLTLSGDYLADVPLVLPSRLHFRLNGSVQGNLSRHNQAKDACPYGIRQYFGMCALILIEQGTSFVSVTGGTYTCTGDTAFAISCEGCSNLLIQNLTASGCGNSGDPAPGGNINFFSAGPGVEVRNVESFHSVRASQLPPAPCSSDPPPAPAGPAAL